jgi:cobalt-precorrin 5A hydrolase
MNDLPEPDKIAIIAITKNGIGIAKQIKNMIEESYVYVPEKFNNSDPELSFFTESVTQKIGTLFKSHNSLICIFSLGAVIRLISPHIKDKKTDPAVVVIDDAAKFVISTLSGHLGGANELTLKISELMNSIPVITTAADVNNTIPVDLVGKNFGWTIDNFENVTKVSAMMVNEEIIGFYQDSGEKKWWKYDNLPKNIKVANNLEDLLSDEYKGALIVSDRTVENIELLKKSVVYRPKSLYIGIGLHWNTSSETIMNGVIKVLDENKLSLKSIKAVSSLDKGKRVRGLDEFCQRFNLPLQLYSKNELDKIEVPNPSEIVGRYEGTSSVSEASSIAASKGKLVVPKNKFPPDLTIAISRGNF